MATSPGKILTDKILKRHGSRSDLRLWRNATAHAHVGNVKGRLGDGSLVLFPGAVPIQAGLGIGSPDLIGIRKDDGQFIAIEVKAGKDHLSKEQKTWIKILDYFGALVCVARSVEDVDELLGEPR